MPGLFGKKKNNTKQRSLSSSSTPNSDDGSGTGTATLTRVGEGENALARLTSEERKLLLEQIETPDSKPVTYFGLMRYASRTDRILQIVGLITCAIAGAALPLMTIVFGALTQSFTDAARGGVTPESFQNNVNHQTLFFVYIFIGVAASTYIYTCAFIISGENMTRRIREQYLRAILRQNTAYFDKLGAGEVTTRITADTNLIQDGISEKIGLVLQGLATFVSAFVVAFIKNWKLSIILFTIVPAMFLCIGGLSPLMDKKMKLSLEYYASGGTLAEEVISSIRVTQSFGTQNRLAKLFDTHLDLAEKAAKAKQLVLGILLGLIFFIMYDAYALAFWEGGRLILRRELDTGAVIQVFFATIIGAFSVTQVAPNIAAFFGAVAAGRKIFETIDRKPIIDVYDQGGHILKRDDIKGEIELEHVKFIYPARPELTVLHDMSLRVPAGKVTALVGASGSGKSTIVGLVERFYDPIGGIVKLDGVPIKEINVNSLRSHVALVSQEPNLFATTVFANVAHGLIGTQFEHVSAEEKDKLVRQACTMANAADFIERLPNGYDTHVGEKGMLLSGGQKQRVAIARAVVGDPVVLILDEATAALDSRSEGVVQDALDRASHNRTTIVVAHRLSTIRNAHNIVVMSKGRIVEQGKHDELLEKKSAYYALVEAQRIAQAKKEEGQAAQASSGEIADVSDDDDVLKEKSVELGEKSPAEAGLLRRIVSGQSVSEQALKQKHSDGKKKDYSSFRIILEIAKYNSTEIHYMIVGIVCSVLCGAVYPAQAIVFSKLITTFVDITAPTFTRDVNFYALIFFIIAIVEFFAYFGTTYLLGMCSEMMVRRVRLRVFKTMLRQDISFFDREENSTGALTSSLATQCSDLAGLHGSTIGMVINSLVNILSSAILSLAVSWRIALVAIACLPILLISGYLRLRLLKTFQEQIRHAYEKSANYACEATSVIRTVASLTREKDVFDTYQASLSAPTHEALVSCLKTSVFFAISSSVTFLINGLVFWYGSTQIRQGKLNIGDFFIAFIAITFGGQSAGQFFSMAPDLTKARTSGAAILRLINKKPEIDVWSEDGVRGGLEQGTIEFKDVHFRYPTRPDVPVLRGLNLKVEPGQYVALVGPSGCGKSTTIGLIERFYDPLSGGVEADGRPLQDYHLAELRKTISLVSQEPTLYQGTIRFNITLGAHEEDVSQDAIEQACRDANILDFIQSLPQGFETLCGNRGTALSGGRHRSRADPAPEGAAAGRGDVGARQRVGKSRPGCIGQSRQRTHHHRHRTPALHHTKSRPHLRL